MTWIVVSTRIGCEHLAKMDLERLKYVVYLPLFAKRISDDPKPLFPRYLFVNTEPREGMWSDVNTAKGVTQVLRTGDYPSRVPETAIEAIKRREQAGVIHIRPAPKPVPFRKGEQVRIHEGPFSGFDAIFVEGRADNRVAILLNLFGRVTETVVTLESVA